jgi:hypothetical protein
MMPLPGCKNAALNSALLHFESNHNVTKSAESSSFSSRNMIVDLKVSSLRVWEIDLRL